MAGSRVPLVGAPNHARLRCFQYLMMNALTRNLIVLLLFACRLVRFGGDGIVFLWKQLPFAVDPPQPLLTAGHIRRGGRLWSKSDVEWVDLDWLGQPPEPLTVHQDRRPHLFAVYHLLESPVFFGTASSRLRDACLKCPA